MVKNNVYRFLCLLLPGVLWGACASRDISVKTILSNDYGEVLIRECDYHSKEGRFIADWYVALANSNWTYPDIDYSIHSSEYESIMDEFDTLNEIVDTYKWLGFVQDFYGPRIVIDSTSRERQSKSSYVYLSITPFAGLKNQSSSLDVKRIKIKVIKENGQMKIDDVIDITNQKEVSDKQWFQSLIETHKSY